MAKGHLCLVAQVHDSTRAHHPLRTTALSPTEAAHYARFAADMADRRCSLGLTQAELDDRLGISEGMVAKWESRSRFPGAFNLMCWSMSLGVRIGVIIEKEQP